MRKQQYCQKRCSHLHGQGTIRAGAGLNYTRPTPISVHRTSLISTRTSLGVPSGKKVIFCQVTAIRLSVNHSSLPLAYRKTWLWQL